MTLRTADIEESGLQKCHIKKAGGHQRGWTTTGRKTNRVENKEGGKQRVWTTTSVDIKEGRQQRRWTTGRVDNKKGGQ